MYDYLRKEYAVIRLPQNSDMLDIKEALGKIYTYVEPSMKEAGMTGVRPEGLEKGEIPVVKGDNGIGYRFDFKGESSAVAVKHFDNKLAFELSTTVDADGNFTDYQEISVSLLDAETSDDKDIRSISGEISDTVMSKFCKPTSQPKVKAPKTVSKAAARSGGVYYDANTLASRLTSSLYPQFRTEYNANINRYGEFLPEDFFAKGCADAIQDTIRRNDPAEMKKLFNLLNEIYPDATNEAQSIIAVTLLGNLGADQTLLANCVDYMCDDLMGPVIKVNKFLHSKAGKSAREKLKNPPIYKPKRVKRPGIMERMMGAAQQNPTIKK